MKNRNAKDVFVVLICLLVSGLALYYFFILYHPVGKTDSAVSKNCISMIDGSVFVKTENGGKWIKAHEGYNLFEGDEIKTYSMSAADISFQNGTKVQLDEYSSLKITEDTDQIVLTVNGSSNGLQVRTSSPVVLIKTENDDILRVEENSFIHLSVKGKTINALVFEGKVTVVSPDGVEKQIAQGSGFVLDYEGVILRKPLVVCDPMTVMSEAGHGVYIVCFKWNKNNAGIQSVHIELFRDRNMEVSVHEEDVEADKKFCAIEIPSGNYFWRISSVDSNGEVITSPEKYQIGSFTIK